MRTTSGVSFPVPSTQVLSNKLPLAAGEATGINLLRGILHLHFRRYPAAAQEGTYGSTDDDTGARLLNNFYHSPGEDMRSFCPSLSYSAFSFAVSHWLKLRYHRLSPHNYHRLLLQLTRSPGLVFDLVNIQLHAENVQIKKTVNFCTMIRF